MTDPTDTGTIQKTVWTSHLLDDLYTALRNARDDDTVRAFANELTSDKQVPIRYLVRKVRDDVGDAQADRLDLLLRGAYAIRKEQEARASSDEQSGWLGRVRKMFGS